jgi:hypothetical protein
LTSGLAHSLIGGFGGRVMKYGEVFSEFLHPGENILWIGRPGFSLRLSSSEFQSLNVALVLSAIYAVGASVLLPRVIAGPSREVVLLALAVAALLLLPVAAANILVFLRSLARRRLMVYALTNERAMIVEASKKRAWAWLRISYDTPIAMSEGRGKRGHISFGRRYDFDTEEWPLFRGFTFFNIKDYRKVADMIEKLQDGMAPPGVVPGIKAMASVELPDTECRRPR